MSGCIGDRRIYGVRGESRTPSTGATSPRAAVTLPSLIILSIALDRPPSMFRITRRTIADTSVGLGNLCFKCYAIGFIIISGAGRTRTSIWRLFVFGFVEKTTDTYSLFPAVPLSGSVLYLQHRTRIIIYNLMRAGRILTYEVWYSLPSFQARPKSPHFHTPGYYRSHKHSATTLIYWQMR